MKIVIVGAAGQVGAALLKHLSKRTDISVYGITRNEFSALPLQWEGYDIKVGSISNLDECKKLLERADIIINAALHLGLPKIARMQNRIIIKNILDVSKNKKVIHLSTISVYGSCLDAKLSTFTKPIGDSTYAKEKLRLEKYAIKEAKKIKADFTILRLGHVFGPGQGLSKQFFDDIKNGQPFLPFDGNIPSNAVHVNRLADSIADYFIYNNLVGVNIFNAVNEPQISWREMYDMHSIAGKLPIINGMLTEESSFEQKIHKRNANRSLFFRIWISWVQWIKNLPIKSFLDQHSVREGMDELMLALPLTFENKVYRKYQTFAAKHRVSIAHKKVAYPWYYSDPVSGPNFLSLTESINKKSINIECEIEEIGVWYKQFAGPKWT